jgi:hypothetical protein
MVDGFMRTIPITFDDELVEAIAALAKELKISWI